MVRRALTISTWDVLKCLWMSQYFQSQPRLPPPLLQRLQLLPSSPWDCIAFLAAEESLEWGAFGFLLGRGHKSRVNFTKNRNFLILHTTSGSVQVSGSLLKTKTPSKEYWKTDETAKMISERFLNFHSVTFTELHIV